MTIKFFRKEVHFSGVRWDGKNWPEIRGWLSQKSVNCFGATLTPNGKKISLMQPDDGVWKCFVDEAKIGDWVVLWPVSPMGSRPVVVTNENIRLYF